ncbi:hypothetical protein [Deinococcus sp. 23YEL01]|uniref:hypothetical protein n=1 Tax=Deinococcus sp. 23YEL01 TaxID=2745871 RepID=UPI001E54773F|nr:hypothetical protein [Deinococcus sp. 23YEL01]MCD0169394.1 hypothetical protein [Deinococcus sp. 23YEL01]
MKRPLRKEADPLPSSGRGLMHVCPHCAAPLTLHDLRDGDQGYWCHPCGRGHRASSPPLNALRRLPQTG